MSAASGLNRIQTLLHQLHHKLNGFAVLDRDGLLLGHVENVIVHQDTYVSLVVRQAEGFPDPYQFLVNSKLIVDLDINQQLLRVDLDIPTVRYLPRYASSTEEAIDPESASRVSSPHSAYPTAAHQVDTHKDHHESAHSDQLEEHLIQLLAERLVINTSKQKIGEVIVRKVIETDMVQVPVRREKLIVEQVSPDQKELAVVELRGSGLEDIELQSPQSVVKGEFHSLDTVRSLLERLAQNPDHGCQTIRLELVVDRTDLQPIYQDWLTQSQSRD